MDKVSIFLLVLLAVLAHSVSPQAPSVRQEQRRAFLQKDFNHKDKTNKDELFHFKAPEDYEHCPKMGYCHIKNQKILHVLRTPEKIIYDTSYDMDSYRRRKTPIKREGHYHLIVSGCSFVLGVGLKANQTLPYFLSQIMENVTPYNYGLAGSGTNSMTAQTESFINTETIKGAAGHMIYVLLNFHISRSNALAMEREWLWDTPVYKERDGKFQNIGTFKKIEPVTTWIYHQLQQLLELIDIKVNFPPLRNKHIQYTCRLIHKAKQVYQERFPDGRFIVYDHPYDEVDSRLLSCLEKKHIEVLSSSLKTQEGDYIEYDGHPSAQLNKKIALEISQYLAN